MTDEELAVDQEEGAGTEEELSEEEKLMARLKEAIDVRKEDLGALQVKLTVTVPRDTLDERMSEQFAELKRDAMVPGFRKGRAPMALVQKRFSGDVGDQLLSQVLTSGYLAAVEKESLKPLGDPLFWVRVKEERTGDDGKPRTVEVDKLLALDVALDHMKLPKEEAFRFCCELELKPDFELPELTGVPLKRPHVAIDDTDVEAELKRMRMMRGRFEPVDDGTVEADDLVYADMKMMVGDEVVVTEENMDIAARNIQVKGVPLDGFGEVIIGRKIGDEVTFEATVPADHENIDLRGKTARFFFKLLEIKRLNVPPFDQEFLGSLGFESEDDLRGTVRASLVARLDSVIRRGLYEQIGRYLVDQTKMEIPEGLSRRQTERSVLRRKIEILQAGVPETEIGKYLDEFRARTRDQMVRDLKLFFILERIAEQREVTVPEERLNAAIAEIAHRTNKRFDRVRDDLSKGDGMLTLYLQLRDEQVLAGLLQDAVITEMEGPKNEPESEETSPTTSDDEQEPPAA